MKNLSALKLASTKALGRTGLVLKKHSPEILTGVGIAGVVTSAVMASKATLKLEEVVEETQTTLGLIAKTREDRPEEYSEKDALHDKTIAYTKGALAVTKLYGPALSLGMASIGCILAAHGIMKKRNAALAAAYKAVEETFNKYKQRVIEELGEDQEREIRLGLKEEEVEDKDGKKVIRKTVDPNGISTYARFFDELSSNWSKEPEYNLMFLKCQQNYANDLLHSRGHIFLNEVYDMLGLPRSKAGQVVGWVMGKDGDNFVDFNIYDFESDEARAFVNGEERSILLDFNVDGTIFDKI